MADEGRGRELPQRARGTPRAAPRPSGSPPAPPFSAELRQRLETAVTAERSQAAAREQDKCGGSGATTPSVTSRSGLGGAGRDAEPDRAVQPVRAANAGPVAEDEVTEWLRTVGRSPSAAPAATGGRGAARCRASACRRTPVRRGRAGPPGTSQLAGRRDRRLGRDLRARHRVAGRRSGQAPRRTSGERAVQRCRGAPGGGGPRGGGCLDRPASRPGPGGVLRSGDVRGA
jgi:hypothetical protein